MARVVVPVVVLAALIGGYVVGQQPTALAPPQPTPVSSDPIPQPTPVPDGLVPPQPAPASSDPSPQPKPVPADLSPPQPTPANPSPYRPVPDVQPDLRPVSADELTGARTPVDSGSFRPADPNILHYELLSDLPGYRGAAAQVVGRYVPADGGRMLDTTTGTLYSVDGDRWRVVATLNPTTAPAGQAAR